MFEKSVAIKPSDGAYSNLGEIYYTLGRYDEAARYYEKAIQMNGRDSMQWHNLAAAYKESNEPGKAWAAFDQTAKLAVEQLQVNPPDPSLLIRLADAYSMLRQPHRAREVCERRIARPPDSV